MTTLRLGQKVTIQQGELEVTGELTCARVYLKGGDPNGYVLSQARPTPEPFPEDMLKAARITLRDWEPALKPPMVTHHTSVYKEWVAQQQQQFKEGDWVLVKDEELTWRNEDGDPEAGNQAYRGHRARVVCVYEDGDVELQHPYMEYPMTVSPHHLTKEDN